MCTLPRSRVHTAEPTLMMKGSQRLAKQLQRYAYRPPDQRVDNLVVGGGVIGLAVGARLRETRPDQTTIVVERHGQIGRETSSRNSEVIHAGIYYPLESLKMRYCIRGREMLYERCERLGIPHRKTQKLILATTKQQIMYLDRLHSDLQEPVLNDPSYSPSTEGVPTYFLSPQESWRMEPDLGPNVLCSMLSTESGIIDSHALMQSLEGEIVEERDGDGNGSLGLGTKVVRIDPHPGEDGKEGDGWVVQTVTAGSSQPDTILTRNLVLSAGLSCVNLLNPLLPAHERLTAYYSKGSYLSYKGPGVSQVSRLLYPCPEPGLAGLGTHLTIDLAGNIKFGPDVEHIAQMGSSEQDRPGMIETDEEGMTEDEDWWTKHLQPSANNKDQMVASIHDYLPNVDPDKLQPDYAGIRPNLSPPGSKFTDFHISYDPESRPGLIALCGFNSPGLTSSLAVATDVEAALSQAGR